MVFSVMFIWGQAAALGLFAPSAQSRPFVGISLQHRGRFRICSVAIVGFEFAGQTAGSASALYPRELLDCRSFVTVR